MGKKLTLIATVLFACAFMAAPAHAHLVAFGWNDNGNGTITMFGFQSWGQTSEQAKQVREKLRTYCEVPITQYRQFDEELMACAGLGKVERETESVIKLIAKWRGQ